MALERTEGLLARSGGGHPKALLAMAGFTSDPLGRPRSTALPPEDAEPIIRPLQFAGLDVDDKREREQGMDATVSGPGEVCTDSGSWGRRGPPLLDGGAGAKGREGSCWDDGAGDNLILATGVRVGAGGAAAAAGGALALPPSSGSRGASADNGDATTRAGFVRAVGRASRAAGRLALVVLRMGEWAKFKYWSKAAYDMDAEWRRDYARARNQTLRDREEQIRVNGTDPWAVKGHTFDFELWTLLRTLSGQNGVNNRF